MLIQYGADITGLDEHGLNIVHVIASNGDEKILSAARAKLPKRSSNKEFQALLTQKCPTYKTHLCFGDETHPYKLNECSALHIATVNMHCEVLNKLLIFRANPHDTDESGRTPLQLVRELIDEFGDLNADCHRKYDEIYEALLKAGREVQDTNVQRQLFSNFEKTNLSSIAEVSRDVSTIKDTVEKISTTTDQSHEVMQQVSDTVTSLQQNFETSSKETMKALTDIKEELTLLKCTVSVEEMVQYEVLNMVAKEVGRRKRKDNIPFWELMADELLKAPACPNEIAVAIKQKVRQENNSDQECAQQFLVFWKSVMCQGKVKMSILQSALENLNVDIQDVEKLQEQLSVYWQRNVSGISN